MKPELDAQQITLGYLFTTLSTNAIIIEPVFYWPEERFSVHESLMEQTHLARLPVQRPNPDATAAVTAAREKIIAIFAAHGCGFFQIGRTYPYLASRDHATVALLKTLKTHLDPAGRLNPGVLGLGGPAT